MTDYYANNDNHAIFLTRRIVANLPEQKQTFEQDKDDPPLYDPKEIYGIVGTNLKRNFDIREVIGLYLLRVKLRIS